jgi:hypothetical protein
MTKQKSKVAIDRLKHIDDSIQELRKQKFYTIMCELTLEELSVTSMPGITYDPNCEICAGTGEFISKKTNKLSKCVICSKKKKDTKKYKKTKLDFGIKDIKYHVPEFLITPHVNSPNKKSSNIFITTISKDIHGGIDLEEEHYKDELTQSFLQGLSTDKKELQDIVDNLNTLTQTAIPLLKIQSSTLSSIIEDLSDFYYDEAVVGEYLQQINKNMRNMSLSPLPYTTLLGVSLQPNPGAPYKLKQQLLKMRPIYLITVDDDYAHCITDY